MSRSRPTASEFACSAYNPELEREFFSRVRLANGSWKTTDRSRLDALNKVVLPFIREIPDRPLEIMDVAVSSGISTQEWRDQLSSAGIEASMIGTDVCIDVRHLRGRFIEALLDNGLNVMHLGLLGRGIPSQGRILHAPFIIGLKAAVRLSLVCGAGTEPFRLVSKAVRTVTLLEDDIEADHHGFSGRFHVIRAANILNVGYFPVPRLMKMANVLLRRLKPNGLLMVSRTNADGTNQATVFRRQKPGLAVVTRLGDGSEIEDVLLCASEDSLVRRTLNSC